MKLAGRTALVTGGSRGIGRAIALELGRNGCHVAVNYLHAADAADAVVEALRAMGVKALAVAADVREEESVRAMAGRVKSELGEVDILVNNAGIIRDNLASFMKAEEWDSVVEVDLRGAFYCIKAVAKDMARRKRGRVINISSAAGLMGDMMRANYASAKAGLLGLTKTMARELAASGVTVNAVAPGVIETDLIAGMSDAKKAKQMERIPAGRFGMPDEVARVVAFLASDEAGYITGETLCVDGGLYMGG